MVEKCALCDRDLHQVEELIMGYCTYCVKKAKAPAKKNHEKRAKPKWETENENGELKNQIVGLANQPRVIELMKRLKSLGEAAE